MQGREARSGGKVRVIKGKRTRRLTPEQRELVRQNLGLVGLHLRKRVRTPRHPRREREPEDLFQEGCLALMRACIMHDPRKHGPLPPYALARIRARIHAALHHAFALVHVPLKRASGKPVVRDEWQSGTGPRFKLPAIQPLPHDALLPESRGRSFASHTGAGPATSMTIRHALRDCFEQAVERGLRGLASRHWLRRNPLRLMRLVADERLLVADAAARTSLSQIAEQAGLSKSRVADGERRLEAAVARQLAADPRVPMLLCLARQNPAGFDGPLDATERALSSGTFDIHADGNRRGIDEERAAAPRASSVDAPK